MPACTVLSTGNFLIYLLNCSGLHSHASFFDPYERSSVTQELFHSRDLKIKYCNTWLVSKTSFPNRAAERLRVEQNKFGMPN